MTSRVVLVVGAAGDIGAATARRLCESGHTVVVSSRSEERGGEQVAAFAGEGLAVDAVRIDVTDDASCAAGVGAVLERHGRLDGLVNCAGVSDIAPVLLGKTDRWEEVLNVNTLGAFRLSRVALRPMVRARWGRIVHVGSISAELGAPYNAIYAASKAGVAGLVRSLALEVAGVGVTVNAVQPGYVKTDLFAQTQGARARLRGVSLEQHEQDLVDDTPTGRLTTPEDVASLVNYLMLDESRSITGQTLNVDGGRTAK